MPIQYIRYKKEYDTIAYRAIRITGTDQAAIESIGASDTAFYNWMAKHKSFREAVDKAREFSRKSSPEALKVALLEYIIKVLDQGGESITTTARTITRQVQRDRNNRIQFVVDTESNTESTDHKGIPKWIADKIAANAPGTNEAIDKLLRSGYEVLEPEGDIEEMIQRLLEAGYKVSDPDSKEIARYRLQHHYN